MRRPLITLLCIASAAIATGCGGSSTPSGTSQNGTGDYTVAVTRATFPAKQHINKGSVLHITVFNPGPRTLPNVTVTITLATQGTTAPAFATRDEQAGMAQASQPFWIVDIPPPDGTTALANSWSLGTLTPGQSANFIWEVHPVLGGVRVLRWKVAPAQHGGNAVLADGREASGLLPVRVETAAPSATISPNGAVKKDYSPTTTSTRTTTTTVGN